MKLVWFWITNLTCGVFEIFVKGFDIRNIALYENCTGNVLYFFNNVLLCRGFVNYLFRPTHKALGGGAIFCGDETEILMGTNEVDSTWLEWISGSLIDLTIWCYKWVNFKKTCQGHLSLPNEKNKKREILFCIRKLYLFHFYLIKHICLHYKLIFMTIKHKCLNYVRNRTEYQFDVGNLSWFIVPHPV